MEKMKAVEEKQEKEKPKSLEKPTVVKALVRIANTDLDGEKRLQYALRQIKGVGYTLAKFICIASGIDPKTKLSSLSESDIIKIEAIIKDPKKFGIPSYLLNRRKDIYTGKDMHLTGSDLDIQRKFDTEKYINLKTYRGWRHILGQPVRGQKTRSHFRQKGKIVGVTKKTVTIASREKK